MEDKTQKLESTTVVEVAEVRFALQAYTSRDVGHYFAANPNDFTMLKAILFKTVDVTADLIQVKGARGLIKEIFRANIQQEEYLQSWVSNQLGPAVGRTWLLSGEQLQTQCGGLLESPYVHDESKRLIRQHLNANVLKSAYALDNVVDAFAKDREAMMHEHEAGKNSKEIAQRYLCRAITIQFGLPHDFANAFNQKYQFDRVLEGDYIIACDKLSTMHDRLAMKEFNETLAEKVIKGHAEQIFE